jgi:2,3-bisphosphoglycerate-independent phosphoglycerate mutase
MSSENLKPVMLVIRDGWGSNHNTDHDKFNAIKLANTPCSDKLSSDWPRTELRASGLDVGLPVGIMGNSEVGHQNIGAGRIVDQEIVRIDKAFSTGSIASNESLQAAFDNVKTKKSALHLMGLASDAGVHSMLPHLYGLIQLAKDSGIENIFIHAFMDGRDTPPKSGAGFLDELTSKCNEMGIGKIATISGRFWAMDRDNRWDRVEKAYNCLTGRKIESTASSAAEAIQHYYANPISPSQNSDEFALPTQILSEDGKPVGTISNGDTVLFFNFRGDRPRELTRAFIKDDFDGFDRGEKLDIHYATLTEYEKGLCENVVFRKPTKMVNVLGSYVSDQGLNQFRCAETEKYPHVTFFFNDYRDETLPGEDWEMAPSPKDVATYDLKPEMSAAEVCAKTKAAILSGKYAFILVNFANPDMVGHTGSLDAAKKACEVVDDCLSQLLEAIDQTGGKALITADHGNSDQLWNPEVNAPHTQHTLNPVEAVIYGDGCSELKLQDSGRLADIAPTILALMGLSQPSEMTGESLIQN